MRYRDLDTGTFLTRDPIGYADGPNVYCYVHCNPVTRFDPLGLKWEFVGDDEQVEKARELYNEAYKQAEEGSDFRVEMDRISDSEDFTVTINLTEGETFHFGDYKDGKVDLEDIGFLPKEDAPMTQSSVFTHELMEQAYKQEKGLSDNSKADYEEAHLHATTFESAVNGGWEPIIKKPEKSHRHETMTTLTKYDYAKKGTQTLMGYSKEYKSTIVQTKMGTEEFIRTFVYPDQNAPTQGGVN